MPHPVLLVSIGLAFVGNAIFKPRGKSKIEAGAHDGEKVPASSFEDAAASGSSVSEELVRRDFAIASASLGSVTAALFLFPPPASLFLTVAGVTGIVHSLGHLLKKSYKSLFEEKRVGLEVVDSIALTGLLFAHYYFLCALGEFVYLAGQKVMIQTKDRSRKSIADIFGELPSTVWVVIDSVEVEIPLAEVKHDDIIVVAAGGLVPADGVIVDGVALIDQHLLTGESQPSEKVAGDQVLASTTVLSGRIYVRVEKSGQDTVVAKIDDVLRRTSDFKSSIQLRGEEMADKMALPTLAASGLALAARGSIGALSVLNGYAGDDVTIVGPMSTLNFLTIASKNGILIKDGGVFESLGDVDTIVFDKTGTLTRMQPHVERIYTFNGYDEDELLRFAATAESRQTHPIARAVSGEADSRGIGLPETGDVGYELGYGIRMNVSSSVIRVGSTRFIEMEGVPVSDEAKEISRHCQEQGFSLVLVAVDGELGGAIELRPTTRPEVRDIIDDLRQRNLSIHIISGDHHTTTKRLAGELGIASYHAEILPEGKAELVKQLQAEGRKVCFVGDGINDSIAMKAAHASVSLSGASAIATDTAQVILVDGSLAKLGRLFELGEELRSNLNVSLLSAVVPGVLTIGGVFFLNLGVFGATLMYVVGLSGGLINSTLPLVKHRKDGAADGARPAG